MLRAFSADPKSSAHTRVTDRDGPSEHNLIRSDRLCLTSANPDNLKLLAVVHGIYHSCKNDSICLSLNGCALSRHIIHSRAAGFAKAFTHFV